MTIKIQKLLFWSIIFAALFLFLQGQYAYLFYYQEQLRLFLFSKTYAWNCVVNVGGVADYIAGFFQQFYRVPGIGAVFTSGLLVACGYLLQKLLSIGMPKPSLLPDVLALIPLGGLLVLHIDENYQIAGTIAFFFCLLFWWLYAVSDKRWISLGGTVVLTSLLYGIGGAVFTLFACGLLVYECTTRKKYWIPAIGLIVLTVLFWICFSLMEAWQGELRLIALPDAYYEYLLDAKKTYWWWGLTLWVGFAAVLFRNRSVSSWKMAVAALLLVAGALGKISVDKDPVLSYAYERDYYLRHQQWAKIVSTFPSEHPTIPTLNVLNLALACRHELGDKLFAYPQNGSQTLISSWDGSLIGAMICSDIFYQVGDIASAQKFAFEGLITTTRSNPRLLKRLVETNIIYGAYAVAEKYIGLLEQTLFYKDWALAQRAYLSDDGVRKCAEYQSKRNGWNHKGAYAVSVNFIETLEQLLVNNPEEDMALQYLSGFYLLNRSLSKFKQLYDTYYHTEVWRDLTVHQQEAVIALAQDNPGEWARMGVGWEVEQRYGAFSQDMADKHNFLNFTEEMERDYGNTYWFYLLFKK